MTTTPAPQRALAPTPKSPAPYVVVAAAVLVLTAAVFFVVKPDREACKTAIGGVADTMLASDKPIDQWQEPTAAELRARFSWPCRFQSDAELEAIGKEVFASKLPEIMVRALAEAFSGLGDPSSEPT